MRLVWCAAVALGVGLAAAPADAALKAYLFVTSSSAGFIQCESTQAGREHAIEAYTFSGHVFRQVSGQTLGPVEHRPLRFTHRVSKCTPQLYQALIQGDTISAIIRFYEQGAGGQEIQVFTVTLANAYLASISPALPDTLDSGNAGLPNLETVSIVYGSITWTWNPTGVSYSTTP